MSTRWLIVASAVATLMQLGCSSAEPTSGVTSDEDFTSRSSGLWVLDGTPEHGDIELLQLASNGSASVVRKTRPAAEVTSLTEMGRVARAARSSASQFTLSLPEEPFSVSNLGDTLTLIGPDGRAHTYRRSYRLYCVPSDPGVEATLTLELSETPSLVGVNGDGRSFPEPGNYRATVRSDALFRRQVYEIHASSSSSSSSSVTVKLPWSDMSKARLDGTLTIVRREGAMRPTPISCERIVD